MKTTQLRPQDVEERWYLYDASEHVLGRMAQDIAMRLMGKDRPTYTPHQRLGAHVVVVNAEKVNVTGQKELQKEYRRYSGFAGGLYRTGIGELRERKPEEIVRLAVRRMLPKTTLGKDMLAMLKVYGGPDHPHAAQKPVKVEVQR